MRPSVREHTDAILVRLQVANLAVGDAVAPDVAPPYAVVHYLFGSRSGTLGELDEDAELSYQVTCVGSSREQAQWVEDKVYDAMAGGIAVAGRSIPRIAPELDSSPAVTTGGSERDDKVTPPVFYTTPRFRVLTTPAP